MRVKLKFPDEKPCIIYPFSVRITDLNYGNHVGNDTMLRYAHEARMFFLKSHGMDELHAGGTSLIMADAQIAFKHEAFYGDELIAELYIEDMSDRFFNLLYRIYKIEQGKAVDVAYIKTGMVCFDYDTRKTVTMGEGLKNLLLSFKN